MNRNRLIRRLLAPVLVGAALLGQIEVGAQMSGGTGTNASAPGEEVTSLPIVVEEPSGWLSLTGTAAELSLAFRGVQMGALAEMELLQHDGLIEVRLRGDVNLVLDRDALAGSNLSVALHAGEEFAGAHAYVRYGRTPVLSLGEWAQRAVPLPRTWTDLPGRGAEFLFTAVNPDGSAFGLAGFVQGDRILLGQRTGTYR